MIDLSVVIAIIAILAAMLLPALQKARAKATAVHCVANIKDSMLNIIMYTADYNGLMRIQGGLDIGATYGYGGTDGMPLGWASILDIAGYELEEKSLTCPDAYDHFDGFYFKQCFTYGANVAGAYGDKWTENGTGSAGASDFIVASGDLVYGERIMNFNKMKKPARVIVLSDCVDGYWHGEGIERFASGYSCGYPLLFHDKKATTAFGDGHVATLTKSEFQSNSSFFINKREPKE